jgi:hypothetical protein
MRLTAELLLEDDSTLERRVCQNDKTVKTYTTAAERLAPESAYLRKAARLLDAAGGRLSAVLDRSQSPGGTPLTRNNRAPQVPIVPLGEGSAGNGRRFAGVLLPGIERVPALAAVRILPDRGCRLRCCNGVSGRLRVG